MLDRTNNLAPLADPLGANTATEAWADLWFYSNPIFVKVLSIMAYLELLSE